MVACCYQKPIMTFRFAPYRIKKEKQTIVLFFCLYLYNE